MAQAPHVVHDTALKTILWLMVVGGASGWTAGSRTAAAASMHAYPVSAAPAVTSPALNSVDPRATAVMAGVRRALEAAQAKARGIARGGASAQQHARAGLRKRASSDVEVRLRATTGTPMQIRGGVVQSATRSGAAAFDDAQVARTFLRAHRDLLGIEDPDNELQLQRAERDELSRRHLRFSQTFRDLPVWPAELIVHLDSAGNVDVMNGAFVRTPHVGLQPVVTSEQAADAARKVVPDAARTAARAELIIYAPLDEPSRLAWKVAVVPSLDADWVVIVDALSGAVLTAFNRVMHATVPGSGADLFGYSRQLDVWAQGGQFYLSDATKPMFDPASQPPQNGRGTILIVDARNGGPDPAPDLALLSASSPNSGWLADGVSLSFNLSETYDYYWERHGRSAPDGQGAANLLTGNLVGVVRWRTNYSNAFWLPGVNAIFFGDGQPYAGELDTVAHEFTHGVTSYTANLQYEGQSGALNESMSDIFGEAVEARTNGAPDWIHGSPDHPTRSLSDPSSIIVGPCPGRVYPASMSAFYTRTDPCIQTIDDQGGVHINSSITNHAFYLLAAGLNGAIGIDDAARIFYRALTVHLVASSQFIDARLACIQSAKELFGETSVQAQKVAEAFDAVQITDGGGTPQPTPLPSVNGPDATLFVHEDLDGTLTLGRREEALGDSSYGFQLSCGEVKAARPAVSGNGSIAAFVTSDADVCFIPTDADESICEECVGVPGSVYAVAMSPDMSRLAVVLRDFNGNPMNQITVMDLDTETTRTFTLVAPTDAGATVPTVKYADAIDFTADNRFVIYDALNQIATAGGASDELWSIYAIDLTTESTLALVPPVRDANFGNPALSQTSDDLLTLDVWGDQGASVMTLNLTTGDRAEIAGNLQGLGAPSYTGDDAAIVFMRTDSATDTGVSLVRQPLAADRFTPAGALSDWVPNAALGVIYRRGPYTGPAPTATPTPLPTSRPTPTPPWTPPACVGDCNQGGGVTVDEILVMVNVALGNASVGDCRFGDASEDGLITVDEILGAVNNALGGC